MFICHCRDHDDSSQPHGLSTRRRSSKPPLLCRTSPATRKRVVSVNRKCSKSTSLGPADGSEPLAMIPETISEHSSGRSTTLLVLSDCLHGTRQRCRQAHELPCVMYDRERRSGLFEVSSMSTVVRALATMPVAARDDEVGPLRPADGRCRRACCLGTTAGV